jgi:hypothetical protein
MFETMCVEDRLGSEIFGRVSEYDEVFLTY